MEHTRRQIVRSRRDWASRAPDPSRRGRRCPSFTEIAWLRVGQLPPYSAGRDPRPPCSNPRSSV